MTTQNRAPSIRELKKRARNNLLYWKLLFDGSATVPFERMMQWPLSRALEMIFAREMCAELEKKAAEDAMEEAKKPKTKVQPWYETGALGDSHA